MNGAKHPVITLRMVREEDCRLLWVWANDPAKRAASFDTEPIPWESHCDWFRRRMNDPDCRMFIALDEKKTPIGQIRFDGGPDRETVIDISIAKEERGKGYGRLLIQQAVEEFFRSTVVQTVHAYIKPANTASIRVFEGATFSYTATETMKGQTALHYVCQRRVNAS